MKELWENEEPRFCNTYKLDLISTPKLVANTPPPVPKRDSIITGCRFYDKDGEILAGKLELAVDEPYRDIPGHYHELRKDDAELERQFPVYHNRHPEQRHPGHEYHRGERAYNESRGRCSGTQHFGVWGETGQKNDQLNPHGATWGQVLSADAQGGPIADGPNRAKRKAAVDKW
jgi:hypothetical protein